LEKNNTSRHIIIKDNSIAICLVLTAVLIVAGLILSKTAVLGEAGSLYADSIQPQVFRFKIDTQSAQKRGSVTAEAGLKPEVPKPAAFSGPISPAPEAGKAAPEIPIVQKEKTPAVVLAKAGDHHQMDTPQPTKVSEHTAAATDTILRTMRGGRHPQFASIVFECSGPVDYDSPRLEGEEIRFKIRNIMTGLRPYRKYRTFDSWVRLNRTDTDLDVSIGVLPGQYKVSDFLMEDPPRLVINIYDKGF